MTTPVITVIILAYNRKVFLMDALDSAVNQSLGKDFYEIAVVKNFEDPNLDDIIRAKGAILINSKNQSLGGKIIEGVKNTTAPVICFLEDDDIFLPTKLSEVKTVFETQQNLSYFHHGVTYVGEQGESIPNFEKPKDARNMEKIGLISFDGNLNNIPKKLFETYPNFNISSMSISRSAIMEYADYLENRTAIVDTSLFFLTLGLGRPMLFESKELSLYRVHGGNDSYFNRADLNSERFLKRLISIKEGYEELFSYLSQIKFKCLSGKVSQLLFVSKVFLGLQSKFNKKYFLHALLTLCKNRGLKYSLSRKDTLVYSVIYLFSRKTALFLYFLRYPERKHLLATQSQPHKTGNHDNQDQIG